MEEASLLASLSTILFVLKLLSRSIKCTHSPNIHFYTFSLTLTSFHPYSNTLTNTPMHEDIFSFFLSSFLTPRPSRALSGKSS